MIKLEVTGETVPELLESATTLFGLLALLKMRVDVTQPVPADVSVSLATAPVASTVLKNSAPTAVKASEAPSASSSSSPISNDVSQPSNDNIPTMEPLENPKLDVPPTGLKTTVSPPSPSASIKPEQIRSRLAEVMLKADERGVSVKVATAYAKQLLAEFGATGVGGISEAQRPEFMARSEAYLTGETPVL